jgi:hypothetical protein
MQWAVDNATFSPTGSPGDVMVVKGSQLSLQRRRRRVSRLLTETDMLVPMRSLARERFAPIPPVPHRPHAPRLRFPGALHRRKSHDEMPDRSAKATSEESAVSASKITGIGNSFSSSDSTTSVAPGLSTNSIDGRLSSMVGFQGPAIARKLESFPSRTLADADFQILHHTCSQRFELKRLASRVRSRNSASASGCANSTSTSLNSNPPAAAGPSGSRPINMVPGPTCCSVTPRNPRLTNPSIFNLPAIRSMVLRLIANTELRDNPIDISPMTLPDESNTASPESVE